MTAVALTGMRQVGKSTLLQRQSELKDRRYFILDNFAHLEAAKRNPRSLLESRYCTIDEVQKCPELLVAIKQEVDRDRKPAATDSLLPHMRSSDAFKPLLISIRMSGGNDPIYLLSLERSRVVT